MPQPIPTVYVCLACGMLWVRPKSWQRKFNRESSKTHHRSLGIAEFCSGAIVVVSAAVGEPGTPWKRDLTEATLAAHRIGGDLAVTEMAIAAMPEYQRLRVEISWIERKVPGLVPESCVGCASAPRQDPAVHPGEQLRSDAGSDPLPTDAACGSHD